MAFTFYTVVNENHQSLFKLGINILDEQDFHDLKIIYLMAINNQILGSGIYKTAKSEIEAMTELLTDYNEHTDIKVDLTKLELINRREYDYRKLLEFGIIAMNNRMISPGNGFTIAP